MLRDLMQQQGFRPIAEEEGPGPFFWQTSVDAEAGWETAIHECSVSVTAEPDPDFSAAPPAPEPRRPRRRRAEPAEFEEAEPDERDADDDDDDEPFDPSMLPAGSDVLALNSDDPKTAAKIKKRRQRHKGETSERPD